MPATAATTRSASTAGQPRPDPRSLWQPAGVHGPSRRYDHDDVRMARRRLARRATARKRPLRAARRHVHHRGHLRRGHRPPRPPRRPRRRRGRAAARRRRSTARTAGGTTASTSTPSTRPTAGRTGSSGSSTHVTSAGWGRPRRRLQPPRPQRQLPRRVRRRTSPRRTRPPGARRSTSTRPAPTRCAAGSSTTRCRGCGTSTSTGCGSTRCTRSSTRARRTCWRSSRSRWRCSPPTCGRPLFLVAESDLNDPRLVRDREAGGYGLDAQWADDVHHALHATLTGERHGYYVDFGPLADPCRGAGPGVRARGHPVDVPRPHARPARSTRRSPRAGASSPTCRTTTRSATGQKATGRRSPCRPAG